MNIHLGYRPGCIGRIVELHAGYYARTAGFGVSFEAKVASGLAAFCVDYQEGRDGLWLAEQDGVIHGSIAIDGSHHETAGAHLRWFITSDASRGQGVGAQLLEAAMALGQRIAANPPQVLRWTKQLLQEGRDSTLDQALDSAGQFQGLAHHTADHAEAVSAFFEKRAPLFGNDGASQPGAPV